MRPNRAAPCLLLFTIAWALFALSLPSARGQGPIVDGKVAGTARFTATGSNATSSGNASACPPVGFDSVANLSVMKYIAAPWYVQKQAPVVYQPASELYCVRAIYVPLNASNPGAGLDVQNYANRGRVNGPSVGNARSANGSAPSFRMEAFPDPAAGSGPTAASKLVVGPAVTKYSGPSSANEAGFGPYWVVAVGPSSNSTLGYDWAIVTGGAPLTSTGMGCRTGLPGPTESQYIGGLWLFSRKPVDPEATAAMEAKAKALGLDTSILKPVQQQGCMYA